MIDKFLDACNAFINVIRTPDSERKGQLFEEFLIDAVFIKENYDLLHLTQDSTTNYFRYVKSSKYPDFKFQDKTDGKKFWVEAKYRTKWYGTFPDQYIYFIKDYQLERYKKVDEVDPVFIAIGTGNRSDDPTQVYLIPVRYIEMSEKIYKKFLLPYEISNLSKTPDREDFVLTSKELWNRLKKK